MLIIRLQMFWPHIVSLWTSGLTPDQLRTLSNVKALLAGLHLETKWMLIRIWSLTHRNSTRKWSTFAQGAATDCNERSLRRHDLRSLFWWSSLSCTDASSSLSLPLFYRTCTFGRWSPEGQQVATLIWIRKIKRSVPHNLIKIAPKHQSFRLQDVFRQVCESHNIPIFQHISIRCLRFVRLIGRHSLYRRR